MPENKSTVKCYMHDKYVYRDEADGLIHVTKLYDEWYFEQCSDRAFIREKCTFLITRESALYFVPVFNKSI